MINCLTNYIGLKNVADSPDSGQYINDLAGITTNQFEATRELNENDGILASWRSLESRTIKLFEMDLMSNLRKFFKNYTHISSGLTGYVDDNTLADHGSGKYAGWLFDLATYSTSMKVEINDVRINLQSAENFNVKIFDANTGEELFSKSVTGIQGPQTVKINQEFGVYQHNKIFVAYDTVIPIRVFNDPKIPGTVSEGSLTTSTSVLASNIQATESGLAVAYNIKCGIDEFVCSRLVLFTEPFKMKLAREMLMSSKYSEEINRFTLLDLDEKNQLIDHYKLEYEKMLNAIMLDLKVPDDGVCFICEKEVNKRVLIP